MNTPYMLLIAGPSTAGKSTLAKNLANHIAKKGYSQIVVALDNYYRDLSHLTKEQREQHNFDHPDAWEYERILHDVHRLRSGQPVDMPTYDFHSHLRSEETHRLETSDYTILEGVFALYYPELCALADLKIYITLEDPKALERKLRRDTAERGRTRDSVVKQFHSALRPSNEEYIRPTKAAADIVLDGNTSKAMQLNTILEHLRI